MRFLPSLLICALFLLLPLVSFLPGLDRSDFYRSVDGRRSLEEAHYRILFEDKQDVSVAFIGLSSMWVGMDAKRVEDYLKASGMDAPVVVTLGANHPGDDLVYIMAKDLLAHRKVDLLVLSTPNRQQEHAHPLFHKLASLKEHGAVWWKLPFIERLRVYSLATLGAPLQIYQQFVPREIPKNRRNLVKFNGAWIRNAGWSRSKYQPFAVSSDKAADTAGKDHLYLPGSGGVEFSNVFSEYQRAFFVETVHMARERGTRVALLSTPVWKDRASEKPVVRIDQQLVESLRLPVLGIPPADLFEHLSEDEIKNLYYDVNHFNTNGARYFTDTMAPAILEAVHVE